MFAKLKQLFSRKSVTETVQPLPVETVADVAIKNVIETTTEVVPEKVKPAKRPPAKEWITKDATTLSNTKTKAPAKKVPAPAAKKPVIRKVSK
jgi:hypothetical protein